MNSSRGTCSMAARTSSSTRSRARSCSSTMRRRSASSSSSGCTGVQRRRDAEVSEHERSDVDDPRRRSLQAYGEHRDLGVAELKRAVTSAACVMVTPEVGELDTRRGRDDQLAGVRICKGSPRALERKRLRQEPRVAVRLPALLAGDESKLLAGMTGNRRALVPKEHDAGARYAGQTLRELSRLGCASG